MKFRSTTFGEVSDQPRSPRETYAPDSSTAIRTIELVDSQGQPQDSLSARTQAAADFLGYATVKQGDQQVQLQAFALVGDPTGGTCVLSSTNPVTGAAVSITFTPVMSIGDLQKAADTAFGPGVAVASGGGGVAGFVEPLNTLSLTFYNVMAAIPIFTITSNTLTGGTTPTITVAQAFSTQKVSYIARVTPHAYPVVSSPVNPGPLATLHCVAIPTTEGMGAGRLDGTVLTRYGLARLMLQYRSLPFVVAEDSQVIAPSGLLAGFPDEGWCLANKTWGQSRYVQRTRQQGGGFFTIPMTTIFWSDGTAINRPFPYKEGYSYLSYTWFDVPYAGYNATAESLAQGCVNDATFDGYPRGTMLYLGADEDIHKGPLGDWLITVRYKFKQVWRIARTSGPKGTTTAGTALGHNALKRWFNTPDNVRVFDYDTVWADKGATYPIHPSYDMSALFRPPQPS